MSEQRVTALKALFVAACVAVVVGTGFAVAAAPHPSAAPDRAAQAHKATGTADAANSAAAQRGRAIGIPLGVDAVAVAAVALCLTALLLWGRWQNHHRCTTCGYCPVWCRCDELASYRH